MFFSFFSCFFFLSFVFSYSGVHLGSGGGFGVLYIGCIMFCSVLDREFLIRYDAIYNGRDSVEE